MKAGGGRCAKGLSLTMCHHVTTPAIAHRFLTIQSLPVCHLPSAAGTQSTQLLAGHVKDLYCFRHLKFQEEWRLFPWLTWQMGLELPFSLSLVRRRATLRQDELLHGQIQLSPLSACCFLMWEFPAQTVVPCTQPQDRLLL